MPKDAAFTMKLEPELREAFMAAAEAADRPASQVVREMMRDFIAHQAGQADYNAFLHAKITAARREVRAGEGRDNAVVEAEFTERRAKLRGGR